MIGGSSCQRLPRALIVAAWIAAFLTLVSFSLGRIHTSDHTTQSSFGAKWFTPPHTEDRGSNDPEQISWLDSDNPTTTILHPTTTDTPSTTAASAESESTPITSTTQIPSSAPVQPRIPGAIPGIPPKIWQSYKTVKFDERHAKIVDSWVEKNPTFRHEILTDGEAETYVRQMYGATRPDIVDLYLKLPHIILKADLLRYLILLAEGGIWSDIDVTCEKPVSEWLPAEMYEDTAEPIGLIVGLEFDSMSPKNGSELWSQWTNWAFAASPGSPHLQYVVDDIVKTLTTVAHENNVGIEQIELKMITDVVEVTGPRKLTRGVAASLGKMLGYPVLDRHVAKIKKPTMLGDVLLMPGNAFAARQNGFPKDQGDALVTHHYDGSWKKEADAAKADRKKLEEEAKKAEQEKGKLNGS
ncbi:hypothetical protein FQN57_005907 [Myotisia sp. PD_48]|nr:hypothetical protein FQN57_005907 [Myotisia sp. PD_48]